MSVEWYDKTQDFTDRDMQFLLLAYRNTFCKSDDGQQVFCHLKTVLQSKFDNPNLTDAQRIAALELLDLILFSCGITNNLKIIKALSGVAAEFKKPEKEETDRLNVS